MAEFSKLQRHLATLSVKYVQHRPLIQRAITVSFIAYVISNTYRGFVRPASVNTSLASSSKRSRTTKSGNARVEVLFVENCTGTCTLIGLIG